jgi:ATP-binding cassette subfamily F protein 3
MIHFSNVTKQYGSKVLYQNASFQIRANDRIGLVGPNGAGKTTIFRILAGQEHADAGEVIIPGRTVVGYFSQDIEDMSGRTVLEEVKAGSAHITRLAERLKTVEALLESQEFAEFNPDKMNEVLEEYGNVQQDFERLGGYDIEHRAQAVLSGLGIPVSEHHSLVDHFSGGWKVRIELAKILTLKPDVLLMDEPTNHLDVETIIWLEAWIADYKGCVVMTSHDRDFMNRLMTRTVEVAHKTITTYSGNYDFYLKEKEIRRAQLHASYARQQEMLAKEEEFIARFAARASHAAQVNSRVKKIEKIERIEIPAEEKAINFEWPEQPRSGEDVLIIEDLSKSFTKSGGSEHLVFAGASLVLKRLTKAALVGVNGAGKSTLMRCITGTETASSGVLQIGTSVKLGYFSQHALELLNPNSTVLQCLQEVIPHASIGYVKTLLGAFLFRDDEVEKKVQVLSGGERSRLVIARMLAQPVNFLVLDEPTNHLDIRTREVLLDALKRFEGTLLIVSHDRYFLRELVNKVYELDKGELRVFEGGYTDYLERTEHQIHV